MPKKKSLPVPEPTFDVEYIRKARVTENEDWEYFIKWGGYSEEDNSWEPESNLTGCRRMLKGFWEQVGPKIKATSNVLDAGYEVRPSLHWINREHKAYLKSAEKKKSQQGRIDEGVEGTRYEGIEAADHSVEQIYSDPDDIPLSWKVGHQVSDKTASSSVATTNDHDHQASGLKRKRDEERVIDSKAISGPPNKRHRSKIADTPGISIMAATLGEDKNNSSRPSSPAGSLFDGESGSDPIPLASKSSTPVATAPSTSRPVQTLSTTSVSHSSFSFDNATPSIKPLPAHLQRKLNPRVKPLALPALSTSGPQGISTKARISAQGIGSGSRSADSNVLNSPSLSVGGHFTASAGGSAGISKEFDGSKWLNENIMTTEELTHKGTANQRHASTMSITQQGLHFSKRWRWAGQLAVGDNESEDAFAEPVGGVLLTESTPLDNSITEISIERLIPTEVDSLCLRHMYTLAALPTAMGNFRISQFARMTADPTDDENSFDDLVAYMTKLELYSQTSLFIADRDIATMFLFPASLEYLWDRLGMPPKIRQDHGLLVAIGFQIHVSPEKTFKETYRSDWKKHAKFDPACDTNTHSHECNRALLALAFPENLFRRVAQKECALFPTPADKELPGTDALALSTVLRNAPGCKIVPVLTGSARFIFIHVGAWNALHKLAGLVDRRLRRQDVQFYTYGSDPSIDQRHWGIHEIFPIGGIVTFTPRAIAEDPEGVERLIGRLDEHPLWACYVLPPVIAMVAEIAHSDGGPNSKLKNVIDALCGILIPIEKGQIALTWQPPSHRCWYKTDKDFEHGRITWMIDQARISELLGPELLLECQRRFEQSRDRSEKDVESRIIRDMVVMQSELREEYRRFVIITDTTGASNTSREAAVSTSASKADIKDGFEFTHVKDFMFGDDYTFAED